MELRVDAFGAVHGAHAAAAENRGYPIRADAGSDQAIPMLVQQRFGGRTHRIEKRIFGASIGAKQRPDRIAQVLIVAARSIQLRVARRTLQVGHLLE
jgi:hypothetical protein